MQIPASKPTSSAAIGIDLQRYLGTTTTTKTLTSGTSHCCLPTINSRSGFGHVAAAKYFEDRESSFWRALAEKKKKLTLLKRVKQSLVVSQQRSFDAEIRTKVSSTSTSMHGMDLDSLGLYVYFSSRLELPI